MNQNKHMYTMLIHTIGALNRFDFHSQEKGIFNNSRSFLRVKAE